MAPGTEGRAVCPHERARGLPVPLGWARGCVDLGTQRRLWKSPCGLEEKPTVASARRLGSAPTPGGCAGGGCSETSQAWRAEDGADVPDQFPLRPPPLHPVCSGAFSPPVVPSAQPQDAQVCSQSGLLVCRHGHCGTSACPPGGPRLTSLRGRDCRAGP